MIIHRYFIHYKNRFLYWLEQKISNLIRYPREVDEWIYLHPQYDKAIEKAYELIIKYVKTPHYIEPRLTAFSPKELVIGVTPFDENNWKQLHEEIDSLWEEWWDYMQNNNLDHIINIWNT